MILETDFTVAAPAERVWAELVDLDAFAACLPGAELRRVDGDETLQGTLRPQLAGSTVECVGTLRPIDVDEDGRSASCGLRVRQAHGSGFATAILRGRVAEAGGSTRVSLSADGRLAALDVVEERARGEAQRLLGELAASLEKSISERASRPQAAPARPSPSAAPALRAVEPHAPAPAAASQPASAPIPAPVAAGAGGLVALLLALVFGRRQRRRGIWFEIRYRW